MSFDPYSIDLPVTECIPSVQKHLAAQNTLIVNAPPGAGKSTLLPLALMEETWLEGKKILMLEPRRLAARSIAERMAYFMDEKVGETIGFRIRFDNKTSDKTQIEVVTEGILTRMIQSDNALEGVGLVIFDEFHERSIHADVALALCREAQQVLRPDLRIMIMSATLNMPQLTSLLKAPAVTSEGRQYPVDVKYEGDTDIFVLPELCVKTIKKAADKHEGDILVFLPGQGEILKVAGMLKGQLKDFAIHPLYGSLPQRQQTAAILPDKNGKRKVVLATSIAETSLTIEGIKVVVDSGFGRTSKFDPNSGLSRLETVRISRDSADQRAGRAGRLSEGFCYRMWSEVTHQRLADNIVPEILEADLANLVLDMAQWGIVDVQQMTWLTPPPRGPLQQANDLLHELEALEDGRITAHGKSMLKLPCHPRIAHMLLLAEESDQIGLATDVAALLEERDPLGKEAGIDINTRIDALRVHRKEKRDGRKLARIAKIAEQYRRLFDWEEENDFVDPYETGVLLTYAYPERIACARPGNNAQFQLSNGRYAMAGHREDLAAEPWLAISHIDARDGMGKIFMASPLNPRDLAPLVKEKEVVTWDTEDGGLQANLNLCIGNIVLKSSPLPDPDPSHLTAAIIDAIKKEGEQLLDFNEEVEQWQNRVLSLRKWNPDQQWPEVSTASLLLTANDWLSPYLNDVKKPADLKKINLKEVLQYSLSVEQQQQLPTLAPEKLVVPSGSKIKLMYRANGEAPVLAVRIQEVFGLAETPRINNGKQAVLMHLLSPGFKPVQITGDLKSFWSDAYFEVRKELKRRYPKHVWPDDPWNEPAIRGVKRKK
ncbi:ATP-dependent helicase HrpB [Roseivirga pacifica]|uniref:ATP-dependent helicase HrpB n=1 Tax=Roseivirga pacifica TaxID=1267423 RepID=A0A1I0QMA6_9BACT|nr:ATP-dependent helicase HrpB [Roseivirga pacifica]RKQ42825.1 ATP-dependent helicase HrpB [Roseivirga pacifica]SEW27890.1 ATP-dependent helicase HrpB [Roseivirga pacifica]